MVNKPTLNIVLPVYNEEKELLIGVQKLVQFSSEYLPDYRWTITIVDNASTDKTHEIARALSKEFPQIQVVHIKQKGRGRAVSGIWINADADYLAYMDIDLSSDLKHLPPLVQSLSQGYDIAIGTRNVRGSKVFGRSIVRTITSKGYMMLIKIFFWVHFSDAQCGFKAITKKAAHDLLPRIKDTDWFFDTELLILAEKFGYRIFEEPVTWTDNPGSTVRVLKTAQGDLMGLWRLWVTRPWRRIRS